MHFFLRAGLYEIFGYLCCFYITHMSDHFETQCVCIHDLNICLKYNILDVLYRSYEINNYIKVTNNRFRMDRDIKVFNRPVMSKIHKKNQELHLQRLKNIKSGMSNRTMPFANSHTLSNKKAFIVQEQKKTQIQKQNVLLFNKMMKIMKRPDPHNQPRTSTAPHRKNNITYSRITQQNRCIFERLQNQKPTISNKRLQEERSKNLTILKFLGKYPNPVTQKISYDSSSYMDKDSKSKLNATSYNHNNRGYDIDEEMHEQQFRHYDNQRNKFKERQIGTATGGRKKYLSQAIEKRAKMPRIGSEQSQKEENGQIMPNNPKIGTQKIGFHQPQILLYQKKLKINNCNALVEFFRLYNKYQILSNFEELYKGKLQYQLSIPENQGNQFFSLYNYDYQKIAEMLIIEDGNLVVDVQSQGQRKEQVRIPEIRKMPVERASEKLENEAMPIHDGQWENYEEALQELVQ